jgi:hypothetical protein
MVEMFRHMRIGRIVTAERDTAGLAGSQMDPVIPGLYTFFADGLGGGLQFFDLLDMMAAGFGIHIKGVYTSLRYLCTKLIAIEPSPTAEATRFMAPARTSPAANMPGQLVSSR